jgi:hypothetical protein
MSAYRDLSCGLRIALRKPSARRATAWPPRGSARIIRRLVGSPVGCVHFEIAQAFTVWWNPSVGGWLIAEMLHPGTDQPSVETAANWIRGLT